MAEARGEDIDHQSRQIHMRQRDLLRRFSGSSRSDESAASAVEDSGEVELSLGLSLGGCFGVDPNEKGLLRSSSVASFSFLPMEQEPEPPVSAPHVLSRTCSLPVETDEEQRKRKELQMLRRMQAKRKRSEKRGVVKPVSRDRQEEICGDEVQRGEGKAEVELRGGSAFPSSAQLGAANGALGRRQQRGWAPVVGRTLSQGSVRNRAAGCSTGGADYDCRPMQAHEIQYHCCAIITVKEIFNIVSKTAVRFQVPTAIGKRKRRCLDIITFSCAIVSWLYLPDIFPVFRSGLEISGTGSNPDARSPSTVQPLASHSEQKEAAAFPAVPTSAEPAGCTQEEAADDTSKRSSARSDEMREMARTMIEQMPCVSTRGDGPDGRRVEGFLYKYSKGEEVRIVCVCHGSFLTPAEFVKHGGGGDVDHPLRHIVVNPLPSEFL